MLDGAFDALGDPVHRGSAGPPTHHSVRPPPQSTAPATPASTDRPPLRTRRTRQSGLDTLRSHVQAPAPPTVLVRALWHGRAFARAQRQRDVAGRSRPLGRQRVSTRCQRSTDPRPPTSTHDDLNRPGVWWRLSSRDWMLGRCPMVAEPRLRVQRTKVAEPVADRESPADALGRGRRKPEGSDAA